MFRWACASGRRWRTVLGVDSGADRVPVWLLDVDGVVSAIAEKGDPAVWPRGAWRSLPLGMLPLLVADPVLAFLRQVHTLGAAELRCPARGSTRPPETWRRLWPCLPSRWPVNATTAATTPAGGGRWPRPSTSSSGPWCGPTTTCTPSAVAARVAARAARGDTLLLRPAPHTGLAPCHLRAIASFLRIDPPLTQRR